MAESGRFVGKVDERVEGFLTDRASILASIAEDMAPFAAFSRRFLSGGKRFRAQFCYLGWRGVRDDDRDLNAVVSAAAALELFHGAALVHDDLIDNSDTRRGADSAHRYFQHLHADGGFAGDREEFGRAAAVLLGDLLLCFSDDLFEEAIPALADAAAAVAARGRFSRMRMEVTAGQYLDVLDEHAWVAWDEDEQLSRAQRVAVYKSARYSVVDPLAIGAAMGNARESQLATLNDFGLPLGIAFQLRDDLLGMYGNSEVTGKPSGDDLREGKRTVLIALARRSLPAGGCRLLDELLGDASLDDEQIRMLQRTIAESGAVEAVEGMIDRNVDRAQAALDEADLDDDVIDELRHLVTRLVRRAA